MVCQTQRVVYICDHEATRSSVFESCSVRFFIAVHFVPFLCQNHESYNCLQVFNLRLFMKTHITFMKVVLTTIWYKWCAFVLLFIRITLFSHLCMSCPSKTLFLSNLYIKFVTFQKPEEIHLYVHFILHGLIINLLVSYQCLYYWCFCYIVFSAQ